MYYIDTNKVDTNGIDTVWEQLACLCIWINVYLYVFKYYDPVNNTITGYGISIQHNRS